MDTTAGSAAEEFARMHGATYFYGEHGITHPHAMSLLTELAVTLDISVDDPRFSQAISTLTGVTPAASFEEHLERVRAKAWSGG